MHLNSAMFSQNGGCGYVLKPKPMRFMKAGFLPTGTGKVYGVMRETLNLSASCQTLRRVAVKRGCR